MRTRTVTERIGENTGPIDWDYDFESHGWNLDGSTNPKCVAIGKATLQRLCDAGGKGQVKFYGEWRDVLAVGMYDGWPYWRPVPSVCLNTFFGAEWHSFLDLRDFRENPAAGS